MKSKMSSDSGETWRSVIRVPVKAALRRYQLVSPLVLVGTRNIEGFDVVGIRISIQGKCRPGKKWVLHTC